MKTILRLLCGAVLGVGLVGNVSAVDTAGTVTLTVQLTNAAGQYAPKHVVAVWVTNQALGYIKCLRKDGKNWTGEGTKHLDKLTAARGSSTNLDGFSGATISTYSLFTVTWNCSNANNTARAPDGTYFFHVEFTENNSAGPYSGSLPMLKGTNAFTTNYPNQTYIKNMTLTYTPTPPPHDIAVTRITPVSGVTNTTVSVQVLVTNKTISVETNITVTLTNLTSASLIGSQTITSLAANTATTLTFPWNTAGLPDANYSLQAKAGPVTGETSTADNTLTSPFALLLTFAHDVAVSSMGVPVQANPGIVTNVTVGVTNKGGYAESFAVVLTDLTDARPVGTNQVSNLAVQTGTTVTIPWTVSTTNLGNHTLRAVAGPVASETALADNTNTATVLVWPMQTNVFIAKGSAWRYHDLGIDLTDTPWARPDYYDLTWNNGPSPLGYGQTSIATTLGFGPDPDAKYPTCYFRQEFFADALPTSLTFNVRRDAGVVFYLNGVELVRMNAPTGAIRYPDYFTNNTISGADQYTYFTTNAAPTNLVVGRNVLAAEVHQCAPTNSDLVLDVEMLGAVLAFTPVHDVAASGLSTPTDALAGDRLPVTITLTNRGNVTETALVMLRDAATGQLIGTQTISGLVAGGSISIEIDWATLGATNGTHTLQAFTVIGGVTNFAGAVTGPATVSGSGFGLNAATVVGSVGGRCSAVTASGSRLVVAVGATLEVWDRSNPAVPARVGSVRLPGLIEDLVVSGTFAYVACGSAGVQFVDLSAPSRPAHVNTYNTSGHASGLAVSGSYLYVADGVAGLRIVDIATPAAPSLAGAYYTAGPARAVSVSGMTAYLLDAHAGLLILNVGAPATPSLLGSYTGIDAGQDLAVAGGYAYVVDANNHFFVVDVSNPAAPTLANAANTYLLANLVAQSLSLNGTTAYVAAGDGGLAILNVAASAAPVFVGTVATPGQAVAASVSGPTLYLADGLHGLQVYDVTTATSPALQTDLPTSIRACDVAVNNSLAFVAAGESGLRIYNVASPATPVWLGWFAGALNARCVAISGSTAYVGDGQYGLKIVNVAAPASPALLGSWSGTNLSSLRNLGVSGSLVVASDGRQVCLFNVSTPASPALVAAYAAPAFAFDMTVTGTRAYLACGNAGLVILEIGAATLTPRSLTDTPGLASGIAVSGNSAYVADGANGWLIYDVSNPALPTPVKANTAQGPVSSVAVAGVLATLGNGANAAVTMDVTQPLTPVTSESFAGLVNALRITAAGGQTYVSENEAGLAVLGTPLVLQIVPPTGGSTDLTLQWVSKSGRTYAIYASTNLALGRPGFNLLQGNLPATPPLNSVPINSAGNESSFYIISEQ